MTDKTIDVGDFVVVQRQGYTKLHKMKQHGNFVLGSFTIEMDNILGEKYSTTFQMKNVPNTKKFYRLEKVEKIPTSVLNITKSGIDNREILDDGQSQSLSTKDIDKLKNEELSSNNIVEQLISNSKTFSSKTEYSQEKYIKKKEKKYFEYVQVRKPSIRLLAQMFHRQDLTKTLGIRIDDLSQILTYSNIHTEGNHLLFDSGTSGLMTASIMNAIGSNTSGKLIHMHPGNECQRTAFQAMQFPQEHAERCINVNLYSVLRCFYQNKSSDEPDSKKIKLDEKLKWQVENEKACEILRDGTDSLIITSKEHPVGIVKHLEQFLKGGRNIVVFSLLKEPLQDLYLFLKSQTNFIGIRLSNNFMRSYQVLPNRTHPEVTMSCGGYVLSATKLVCDK